MITLNRLGILLFIISVFTGCKSSKNTQQSGQNKGVQVTLAGDTGKPKQIVKLPVFIPALELQNQLYQEFFAPNYGKYYPCRDNDCDDAYKDLYVEEPFIHIQDSLISIKMHLAGVAHLLFSFNVAGDIQLTARPVVKNDTLFFKNVKMQPSSQSLLLAITTSLFGKIIEEKIQEKSWYSFRTKLDATTGDIRKKFPLKWGNICLLLNLNKIYLNDVKTQEKPIEGIIADFDAELTVESGDFCGQ
ncbi:MAG: hypothetical protein ACLQQ4_15975 [Bacteroidia bacterium]